MSDGSAKPGDYARFARHEAGEDSRFTSGTPAVKRNEDLDFIRMTGMTRPANLRHSPATPTPAPAAAPWQGESQAALGFREIIEALKPEK